MKYIYNGYANKADVKKAIEAYEKAGNPEPLKKLIAVVGDTNLSKSTVSKIQSGKGLSFQEMLDLELNLTGRMKDVRR